jgi:outer membrane lipoprotein-sorting protein
MTYFPLLAGKALSLSGDPRVFHIVQKMESTIKSVEDYTCEVEQTFYQDGSEEKRSNFRFYFKKGKKIRVDFTHPYPSLTIIYLAGEDKATVVPFRFMPLMKFRFSIQDSRLKTRAGQRIDQTDMEYFIQFIRKNLESTNQGDSEFRENQEESVFSLFALDYITGKNLEKYRIYLSKKIWLPTCIERYDLKGSPIETTAIRDYAINTHLDDRFFDP